MNIRVWISVLLAALMSVSGAIAPQQAEYGRRYTKASTSLTAEVTPSFAETADVLLTAEEAREIALAHAGLTADQVKGLRAEYDVDDGIKEYEVEFRCGDYEYDYTIHAETGEILKNHKEYDPPKAATTQPAATEPAPTEPPATEPAAALLTADDAKAIALAHAGLTADQVKGLRAEYDVDDGIKEYEVEFRCGGWEYEYDIHAETGKILSWDKDWDD